MAVISDGHKLDPQGLAWHEVFLMLPHAQDLLVDRVEGFTEVEARELHQDRFR